MKTKRIPAAWYRVALFGAALLAGTGAGGAAGLGVERVFPALSFTRPLALLQAPGDASRWFVVEQAGRVRTFANSPTASTATTFIEITDRVDDGGEMGLLGMAFHPRFPADPRVFLSYTNDDAGRESRIAEFRLGTNGNLDPSTERILLRVRQPERNHNGGQIAFGPDGYLYAGYGDGGGANDRHGAIGNAQRLDTLLGKMLRIDIRPRSGYGIPPDNPFAGGPQCGRGGAGAGHCPEIYAWGLRNPWRWSFDRQTGALWVGDVGQGALEEIDRVRRGGNYGWRCREGTRDTGMACGGGADLIPPVAEYGRGEGRSVTGGYVYRGRAIASLRGRYVFGDYASGRVWHLAADARPTVRIKDGFATDLSIASFAEGADGELYIVDYGGRLYRLTGP
jgi:glucose/arabinose dehydrogenase